MPFFRPGPGPYALALAMTGIRLGERFLHVGSGTPDLFGALATKVGLSGHAAGIAADEAGAESLKQAAARAGALVEVEAAAPSSLPYPPDSFDIVVIDATQGTVDAAGRWLAEAFRVLRMGGRLIVAERTGGSRIGALFAGGSAAEGEAITRTLAASGFRPVRKIAERDRWRFTEGLKPRH